MIQSLQQPITVDKFINQYGDDARWELIDGELEDDVGQTACSARKREASVD